MLKSEENAAPTGVTVARNVARLRRESGMSLRELALLLEAAGHRLGVSALSRIENESRAVDVDDLTALAVALNVSPLALLLRRADRPTDNLQVTGLTSGAPAIDMWRWGLGDAPVETREQMEDATADTAAFRNESLPPWLGVKVGPGWDTAYGFIGTDR